MKITGHEKGFTLVEVLVALAILGSIAGVMAMTVSQTITGSERSNNQATVLNQVQNAGYWIVRDAQMAELVGSNPQKVVSFKWWDWSGGARKLNKIDYTLEDNELIRTFKKHEGEGEESGAEKIEMMVAMYIDQVGCTYVDELLKVSITACFGEASLTKEYEVNPRVTGLENPWE